MDWLSGRSVIPMSFAILTTSTCISCNIEKLVVALHYWDIKE